MYDKAGPFRAAARMTEPLPSPDADAAARLALERVRELLTGYLPGMTADPARLAKALAGTDPAGAEREFALGWLAWLAGDWAASHPHLLEARRASEGSEPFAPCAYWAARVGVLLEQADAVAEYESALKRLGGSPQATAWYVDLLWRAGRVDRAEQVWKSLRGNKRVAGCDEGPLLEARSALRRGELGPAEKLLREMSPRSGVVHAERQLLLARALVGLRKHEAANEALDRAASAPYPASVVAAWRKLVGTRLNGEAVVAAPAGWREYLAGQESRKRSNREAAIAHHRAAAGFAATQPYATYALACLGEADPQAVLAATPGAFFAARARAWSAVERFRRREGGPGEFLEATDQAARAGVEAAPFEPYRAVARLLQARPSAGELAALVERGSDANTLRAALELAARLPAEESGPLLARWLALDPDADLRDALSRQLVRLALHRRDPALLPPAAPDLAAATELLTRAGRVSDGWAESVAHASGSRGIRQSVRLVEAAQRADLDAVAAMLGDADAWHPLPDGPPRFVLRALVALAQSKPGHPALAKALPRWLGLWRPGSLGPDGAALAGSADAAAPPGVDADAWFSHHAARALLRDDPAQARALLQRTPVSLPAVERLAQAQALGRAFGVTTPALLTDMVDLLRAHPAGATVLGRPPTEARERLAALADRPDATGPLLHHVALVESRLAERYEATDPMLATLHGRRAWGAWLGFLAAPDGPPDEARRLVVEHLIARHRRRVNDHLARDEREPARSHWQLVMQLPALARGRASSLAEELAASVERFRDELATEHLLATREAMRFGDIPEGWRADYERGLASLERLLALDQDNVRLLTAHAETCADWFLDLYHQQGGRLFDEVERTTPFAERLAGLVGDEPGEVAARSALAEFWKFRGFCAGDNQAKLALYREALAFNPGNDNVRNLIADLEGDEDE